MMTNEQADEIADGLAGICYTADWREFCYTPDTADWRESSQTPQPGRNQSARPDIPTRPTGATKMMTNEQAAEIADGLADIAQQTAKIEKISIGEAYRRLGKDRPGLMRQVGGIIGLPPVRRPGQSLDNHLRAKAAWRRKRGR